MLSEQIAQREIEWHRHNITWQPCFINQAELDKYRLTPHYKINSKQFMFHAINPVTDKRIMDFGSGVGINGVELAMLGADVEGFDISPESVDIANRLAQMNTVFNRCKFFVGEATRYPLTQNTYDVILIDNVLHHIPPSEHHAILLKIDAALKSNGKLVIREPISFLPWLDTLKRLIGYKPEATPDEHELTKVNILAILNHFPHAKINYFAVTGRLCNIIKGRLLSNFICYVDYYILKFIPGSYNAAGVVVIIVNK